MWACSMGHSSSAKEHITSDGSRGSLHWVEMVNGLTTGAFTITPYFCKGDISPRVLVYLCCSPRLLRVAYLEPEPSGGEHLSVL